jgi:hypothetical protein
MIDVSTKRCNGRGASKQHIMVVEYRCQIDAVNEITPTLTLG